MMRTVLAVTSGEIKGGDDVVVPRLEGLHAEVPVGQGGLAVGGGIDDLLGLPGVLVLGAEDDVIVGIEDEEEAAVEDAALFHRLTHGGEFVEGVADIVDADDLAGRIEDGFVARDVRLAEDVDHAVKRPSPWRIGGDGPASGRKPGADRAGAVAARRVGGDADIGILDPAEERGGAAHDGLNLGRQCRNYPPRIVRRNKGQGAIRTGTQVGWTERLATICRTCMEECTRSI